MLRATFGPPTRDQAVSDELVAMERMVEQMEDAAGIKSVSHADARVPEILKTSAEFVDPLISTRDIGYIDGPVATVEIPRDDSLVWVYFDWEARWWIDHPDSPNPNHRWEVSLWFKVEDANEEAYPHQNLSGFLLMRDPWEDMVNDPAPGDRVAEFNSGTLKKDEEWGLQYDWLRMGSTIDGDLVPDGVGVAPHTCALAFPGLAAATLTIEAKHVYLISASTEPEARGEYSVKNQRLLVDVF